MSTYICVSHTFSFCLSLFALFYSVLCLFSRKRETERDGGGVELVGREDLEGDKGNCDQNIVYKNIQFFFFFNRKRKKLKIKDFLFWFLSSFFFRKKNTTCLIITQHLFLGIFIAQRLTKDGVFN